MTLKLELSPELEARLKHVAETRGVTAEEQAVHLIGQYLQFTPQERAARLRDVFERTREEEEGTCDEVLERIDAGTR